MKLKAWTISRSRVSIICRFCKYIYVVVYKYCLSQVLKNMFCLVYVFAYFMFCCLITNRELYNNRISSLPSDVFKHLYSIRNLFIEHNSISSIPLKTFRSTHNMEFL